MSPESVQSWRCTVCGYVHEGPAPPDTCPVCGAGATDFEPFNEMPSAPDAPTSRWRCSVCGYEHEGPAPPDTCPVCGARADAFEAVEGETPSAPAADSVRLVIAGGGIAGVSAAEAAHKASPNSDITLVSEEGRPYYRISLTRFLAGEVEEKDLPLHPDDWYEERHIRLVHARALSVDVPSKALALDNETTLRYDRLVLACGARAFVPPIPGAEHPGVYTLRTRTDAGRILDAARSGARCVVVGGGILGLETAGALQRRGLDVALIEGHAHLMPRQLPESGSRIMGSFIRDLGIDLHIGSRPASIDGDAKGLRVSLENGTSVPADFVILATGVRPDVRLAQTAGVDRAKGVVADDRLCTTRSGVYAAGDVSEHRGMLYGNWSAAQVQGTVAGFQAVGRDEPFRGLPRAHTLKVLGLGLVSIGLLGAEQETDRIIEKATDQTFHRFVIRNGQLAGAVLLGDTTLGTAASEAVRSGVDARDWLKTQGVATPES